MIIIELIVVTIIGIDYSNQFITIFSVVNTYYAIHCKIITHFLLISQDNFVEYNKK